MTLLLIGFCAALAWMGSRLGNLGPAAGRRSARMRWTPASPTATRAADAVEGLAR